MYLHLQPTFIKHLISKFATKIINKSKKSRSIQSKETLLKTK